MGFQIKSILWKYGFLFLMLALLGCQPKEEPTMTIIRSWVHQEYGSEAILEISGELNVNMPGIEGYRGGIIMKDIRKEGIFFFHQSDESVHFMEGLEIPWENKGSL